MWIVVRSFTWQRKIKPEGGANGPERKTPQRDVQKMQRLQATAQLHAIMTAFDHLFPQLGALTHRTCINC